MKKLNNQNLILLLVLIGLSGVASFLYFQHQREASQLVTADRGIAVKNITDVSKIVVKHVKLQPIVFTRAGGMWLINGKYPADPGIMVHIEKVLTGVRLLYVPPHNSIPTILKSVKENGIQVDVYLDNGKTPEKIIHIGSDLQDGDGTFMVLGGSKQAFAMHLPGLSGGLRSRFEQPLDNYRDKFIFQTPLEKIKSLKVIYPKDNVHSFLIENKTDLMLTPLMHRHAEGHITNKNFMKSYLSQFESLGAEKLMNQSPEKERVLQSLPSCAIELAKKDGTKNHYAFYKYDDPENQFGLTNSPGEIRFQNRLYVLVDSTDFYSVQTRVFGNVFRSYSDFLQMK